MAFIHPMMLATVVVVTGTSEGEGAVVQGSGFLLARPDEIPYGPWKEEVTEDKNNWYYYGVTCKHVIEGILEKEDSKPVLHLNRAAGEGTVEVLTGREQWHRSSEDDVAIVKITGPDTKKLEGVGAELKVWHPSAQLLREEMQRENVWAGHPVFIMGFPEGRGWNRRERNVPIVRQGIIAQVDQYLRGESGTFLIDGNSYGGNSGGPVIAQPILIGVGGTHAHAGTSLIGMVCASSQGEREEGWWDGKKLHRLKETSGLGVVVGIETIQRTIDEKVALDKGEGH